jgi:hypothetical protein
MSSEPVMSSVPIYVLESNDESLIIGLTDPVFQSLVNKERELVFSKLEQLKTSPVTEETTDNVKMLIGDLYILNQLSQKTVDFIKENKQNQSDLFGGLADWGSLVIMYLHLKDKDNKGLVVGGVKKQSKRTNKLRKKHKRKTRRH